MTVGHDILRRLRTAEEGLPFSVIGRQVSRPDKTVNEALGRLLADGLVEHRSRGAPWKITPKGRSALLSPESVAQVAVESPLVMLSLLSLPRGPFEGRIRLLRMSLVAQRNLGVATTMEELEKMLDGLIGSGLVGQRRNRTRYGSTVSVYDLNDGGKVALHDASTRKTLSKMMASTVREVYQKYGAMSIPDFELSIRKEFPNDIEMKIEGEASLPEPHKVAIGTTNPAKVLAVTEVLRHELKWKSAEIVPCELEHSPGQPTGDPDAIGEALKYARQACATTGAEYGVGVQGAVRVVDGHGMLVGGWVVVVHGDEVGIGTSGWVSVPRRWQAEIAAGRELGDIVDAEVKKEFGGVEYEYRDSIGANGFLTRNLYHRVEEFKDATRCALAAFVSRDEFR
ncbi:MAG: DUF84 family protein [Nitrososphaerota archaeon]|jgi:non-canonical (house-cleaning) NTP pyrophosphatase/predicted transcriptional regulator|nr:DUF84 family protein [Nitrososphaerota archaeon]MDG6954230.1 DUF84 family protein [Nitrososphaerota archaeon]